VVVNEGSEEEESGLDGEVQNFSILVFLSCLATLVLLSWFHRLKMVLFRLTCTSLTVALCDVSVASVT